MSSWPILSGRFSTIVPTQEKFFSPDSHKRFEILQGGIVKSLHSRVPTVWGVFVGDNGDQMKTFNSKCGPFPPEPEAEQPTTLTKAQIMEVLFAKKIFTKCESARIIDTLFELIKRILGRRPMRCEGHSLPRF
jgi:hypothetical protein